MGRTYSVCCLILAILVAGLYEKISVEGKLNLGLIGCRFSKSLCTVKEECVDDRLFGNCQEGGREVDQYQYFLDYKTLRVLEKAIYDLISQGYSWDSLYTQCILGNVLLSFRLDRELDQRICTDFATPPSQPPNEGSSLKSLDRYFNEYYADLSNPLQYEDSVDVRDTGRLSEPEFSKKDEYVNIHKYRGHKRDPYSDDYYEDYPTEDTAADYSQYLESLSPQDLLLLESYLAKIENGGGESKEERPPPETAVEDYPSENEASEENPDYLWENGPGARISDYDDQVPSLQLPPSSNEAVDVDEIMAADDGPPLSPSANQPLEPATAEKKQDDSESEFLTPEDAKVLGDLLQDKMEVDDLSSEEVDRLTHQVNAMLTSMGGRRGGGGEGKEESQEEEEVMKEGTGPDIKLEAKKSKPPINQENTNDQMKQQPIAKSKVRVTLKNIKHKKDSGPSDYVVDIKTLPEEVVEGYSEKIGAAQDHYQVLTTTEPRFALLNTNYAWLQIDKKFKEPSAGFRLVYELQKMLDLPNGTFAKIRVEDDKVTFLVRPNAKDLNSSVVTQRALEQKDALNKATGLNLQDSGIGDKTKVSYAHTQAQPKLYILTFILCGCIAGILIAVVAIYLIKRHTRTREKLAQLTGAGDTGEASKDYQDLCRQRMQSKQSEKPEPLHVTRISSVASEGAVHSPSSRSSTSSWSEEPVTSNMDISTGHIVLSYMEDHMKNKDRLDREWEALVAYEAEPCSLAIASDPAHTRKNRYSDILPYDHSRVILNDTTNVSGSDYVNASTITDHDPRNPAYIATQGPLPHTVADFWQMVWEQGSVVLVMLSKLTEDGVAMCHRYWPEEGSDLYHIYEVHLVSEHIWCDDYMVRSFYLKNLQTNETRTVTQFHFLTWPDLGIPASGAKALLEFRRKVNKSYRGRSCPIVVHCSDGCGRSGTYILIDMVLNRMSKGAKEIDIAATLEHIRDQRMHMAKTKEQFEFVLAAVAEEVHAILKALPQ